MNCTCYRELSGGKHSPLCTLKQENRALRAEVTDLVAMRDADAYLIGRLRAEVERLTRELAEAKRGTVKDSLTVAPLGEEEA